VSDVGQRAGVVVSVGCNKGTDLVRDLRMLTNDGATYDVRRVLTQHMGGVAPLMCPPHAEWPLDPARPVGAGWGLCVEPVASTVRWLQARLGALAPAVSVLRVAVSAMPGEARAIKLEQPGVEGFGMLPPDAPEASEPVPMVTLDGLSATGVLPPGAIDVLSVDTEGHDAHVLLGGVVRTLPRVRLLEFEYHSTREWTAGDLLAVVQLLRQFGFVCYWPTNDGRLWPLTACWHESYYQHRRWSNVACANRVLAPALARAMAAAANGSLLSLAP
jgi:FkbM family methyltransferase